MQSRKIRTSWRFTEIQIEKGSTRVYNSLDRHTKKRSCPPDEINISIRFWGR